MPSDDQTEISSAVLLSLIGDAVLATDQDGSIFLFNQAAEEMFGYAADEVFGRYVEMLMPQRFRGSHGANLRNFVEAREPERRIMGRRREVAALRKDGQEFPIEATVSRLEIGGRTVLAVVIRDITRRKKIADELSLRTKELELSDRRLRLALTGGGMGAWEWDTQTGALELDAVARNLWNLPKHEPVTRDRLLECVHPDDQPQMQAALLEALHSGANYRLEFRLKTGDGKVRWLAEKGSVASNSVCDSTPRIVTGVVFDVTERRQREAERQLVAAETRHRLMNTLTLVNSIVNLSARSAETVEEYKQAVQGRLRSLAHTNRLLTATNSGGESLSEILLSELDPYRDTKGGNIAVDGPAIMLEGQVASALGLALHELASNAAKYGALSSSKGRVDVQWRVEDDSGESWLLLNWAESGGPEVTPPTRRGFGTTIMEATLVRALRGKVDVDHQPEGLRCQISVPLGKAQEPTPTEVISGAPLEVLSATYSPLDD